jgi:WD40 repeat protein
MQIEKCLLFNYEYDKYKILLYCIAMSFNVLHKISNSVDIPKIVKFSPDGTKVACADENCKVRIWDVKTGKLLKLIIV